MLYENFIKLFENAVKEHWNDPALSDFKKDTISYHELAEEIETLGLLWKKIGLRPGDKIAINAKSCKRSSVIYMAAQSLGYVAVELFNGFTPADTLKLVNHSDSRILYTEKRTFDEMDFAQLPALLYVADTATGALLASCSDEVASAYATMSQDFKLKYPHGMSMNDVHYDPRQMEDICAIMYTSGSTGNPKGVMLTVRNFSSNIYSITLYMPFRNGENYLGILPQAHIFGLICDLVIPMCYGMHATILGLPPIPSNVRDALMEVKPRLFFGVPLIFIKYIDFILGPYIHDPQGAEKLKNYEDHPEFCKMLHDVLLSSMGGNIELFATGGAAIPFELEELMLDKLKLPFISGYGMTETAPIIAVGGIGTYVHRSCGRYSYHCNQFRVDSPDPEHIAGEVQFKGDHVFAGYYKNPEETAAVFTEDGWFRTGDMGTVDADKNVFLAGRCKNMLLSTNGQNIYPEEIEVLLNALPYVSESLIVQRKTRLTALIVVNVDAVSKANLSAEALDEVMKQNMARLNSMVPAYSAVKDFELRNEPFAKTPKGSIRRFMYR